jgi:hypothetical protein
MTLQHAETALYIFIEFNNCAYIKKHLHNIEIWDLYSGDSACHLNQIEIDYFLLKSLRIVNNMTENIYGLLHRKVKEHILPHVLNSARFSVTF